MKQPTPTEYKGTRFRSKSEAVFACALDISEQGFRWHYEPFADFQRPPGGHQWDFLVYEPIHSRADFYWSDTDGPDAFLPAIAGPKQITWKHWLVEYKPAMPTDTYIKNLESKLSDWSIKRAVIVFGGPWADTPRYGYVELRSSSPGFVREATRCCLAAKNYRFDLAQGEPCNP